MIDVDIDAVLATDAAAIAPGESVVAAAERLCVPGTATLVVIDTDGAPVGTVTESDVVASLADGTHTTSVRQVMTLSPPTVRRTATVREAADRLERTDADSLLVVDEEGALCGLVRARALAPYCSTRRLGPTDAADPGPGSPDEDSSVPADD